MYPFIRWQLGPNYATNDKQKIPQNKTIFILSLLRCRNWTKNANQKKQQKKTPCVLIEIWHQMSSIFLHFFKQLICKRQHVTNCNQLRGLTSEAGTVKKASRWNKPKRYITQIREEVQLLKFLSYSVWHTAMLDFVKTYDHFIHVNAVNVLTPLTLHRSATYTMEWLLACPS